jgi:hypothetical protein
MHIIEMNIIQDARMVKFHDSIYVVKNEDRKILLSTILAILKQNLRTCVFILHFKVTFFPKILILFTQFFQ